MASGNVTLAGNVSGGPDGARTFGPLSITMNSAVTQETQVALIVGSVTVAVPAGATVALIIPPNASIPTPNPAFGGTITVKGLSADSGVVVSAKWPTLLSFDTAPASFVLTSTGTGTAIVWFA